jgi:[ribosomal protein S5]-alanine N-acetyltransferase
VAELTLTSERLLLALPRADQAAAMLDFVSRNRDHLKPWSPPAPEGFYTPEFWSNVVSTCETAFEAGSAVRLWLATDEAPDTIIGSIGYSQIARASFSSCVVGYQLDQQFEGQGVMSEALRVANRYMFEEQKLHRIAANYRPENVKSGRLLARLGFRIEGYAKAYLYIDGAWRDHVLTSMVNSTFNVGWLNTKR